MACTCSIQALSIQAVSANAKNFYTKSSKYWEENQIGEVLKIRDHGISCLILVSVAFFLFLLSSLIMANVIFLLLYFVPSFIPLLQSHTF